jgi:hypothetical protein
MSPAASSTLNRQQTMTGAKNSVPDGGIVAKRKHAHSIPRTLDEHPCPGRRRHRGHLREGRQTERLHRRRDDAIRRRPLHGQLLDRHIVAGVAAAHCHKPLTDPGRRKPQYAAATSEGAQRKPSTLPAASIGSGSRRRRHQVGAVILVGGQSGRVRRSVHKMLAGPASACGGPVLGPA